MEKILYNLALIDTLNFCKANNIDPSGSHLVKLPRRYTYTLIQTATDRELVRVTFHKSKAPTHWVQSYPKYYCNAKNCKKEAQEYCNYCPKHEESWRKEYQKTLN